MKKRIENVVKKTQSEEEVQNDDGFERVLMDEREANRARITGETTIRLDNEYLGRYYKLSVYKDDDGVWIVHVAYGKKGRKCKTPIVIPFTSKGQAIRYANKMLTEKMSLGYR